MLTCEIDKREHELVDNFHVLVRCLSGIWSLSSLKTEMPLEA